MGLFAIVGKVSSTVKSRSEAKEIKKILDGKQNIKIEPKWYTENYCEQRKDLIYNNRYDESTFIPLDIKLMELFVEPNLVMYLYYKYKDLLQFNFSKYVNTNYYSYSFSYGRHDTEVIFELAKKGDEVLRNIGPLLKSEINEEVLHLIYVEITNFLYDENIEKIIDNKTIPRCTHIINTLDALLEELDDIRDMYANNIFIIHGEAGIGKTNLLVQVCDYLLKEELPFYFIVARNMQEYNSIDNTLTDSENTYIKGIKDSPSDAIIVIDGINESNIMNNKENWAMVIKAIGKRKLIMSIRTEYMGSFNDVDSYIFRVEGFTEMQVEKFIIDHKILIQLQSYQLYKILSNPLYYKLINITETDLTVEIDIIKVLEKMFNYYKDEVEKLIIGVNEREFFINDSQFMKTTRKMAALFYENGYIARSEFSDIERRVMHLLSNVSLVEKMQSDYYNITFDLFKDYIVTTYILEEEKLINTEGTLEMASLILSSQGKTLFDIPEYTTKFSKSQIEMSTIKAGCFYSGHFENRKIIDLILHKWGTYVGELKNSTKYDEISKKYNEFIEFLEQIIPYILGSKMLNDELQSIYNKNSQIENDLFFGTIFYNEKLIKKLYKFVKLDIGDKISMKWVLLSLCSSNRVLRDKKTILLRDFLCDFSQGFKDIINFAEKSIDPYFWERIIPLIWYLLDKGVTLESADVKTLLSYYSGNNVYSYSNVKYLKKISEKYSLEFSLKYSEDIIDVSDTGAKYFEELNLHSVSCSILCDVTSGYGDWGRYYAQWKLKNFVKDEKGSTFEDFEIENIIANMMVPFVPGNIFILDTIIMTHGRYEHECERITKKYQWIALEKIMYIMGTNAYEVNVQNEENYFEKPKFMLPTDLFDISIPIRVNVPRVKINNNNVNESNKLDYIPSFGHILDILNNKDEQLLGCMYHEIDLIEIDDLKIEHKISIIPILNYTDINRTSFRNFIDNFYPNAEEYPLGFFNHFWDLENDYEVLTAKYSGKSEYNYGEECKYGTRLGKTIIENLNLTEVLDGYKDENDNYIFKYYDSGKELLLYTTKIGQEKLAMLPLTYVIFYTIDKTLVSNESKDAENKFDVFCFNIAAQNNKKLAEEYNFLESNGWKLDTKGD